MPHEPATLHMLCGKIASGKSTLAARLARDENALLIAEDDSLAKLYPEEIATAADYMRCSVRFRAAIAPLIVATLARGTSVVLDFQANTRPSRAWMKGLAEAAGAAHLLHLLDVPDQTCLARLRDRNAAGAHAFAVTDAQFHEVSRHVSAPNPNEGLTVLRHAPPD